MLAYYSIILSCKIYNINIWHIFIHPAGPDLYNILIEPSPSTMIIELDLSATIGSLHPTGEGLFTKEILWKVKLVGLAVGDSSGTLKPGNCTTLRPALISTLPLGLRSVGTVTFQNRLPPELLLQVNVTLPLSGTTYPPGIGTASAVRLTVIKGNNMHACDFIALTVFTWISPKSIYIYTSTYMQV